MICRITPFRRAGLGSSSVRDAASAASAIMMMPASLVWGLGFLGLLIEIGDELGSMMLRNDIDDLRREVHLRRHLDPFFHMAGNDERAHLGRESVVPVGPAGLGLPDVVELLQLSDVVVGCRGAAKARVGADGFRRRFGE